MESLQILGLECARNSAGRMLAKKEHLDTNGTYCVRVSSPYLMQTHLVDIIPFKLKCLPWWSRTIWRPS